MKYFSKIFAKKKGELSAETTTDITTSNEIDNTAPNNTIHQNTQNATSKCPI